MMTIMRLFEINFGIITHENMNAKRYFMILAQIFKFIDNQHPIRFLIAECDYSLTALTALYYAKLFGVDKNIDIFDILFPPYLTIRTTTF